MLLHVMTWLFIDCCMPVIHNTHHQLLRALYLPNLVLLPHTQQLPDNAQLKATCLADGCRQRGVYVRPFEAQWLRVAVRPREQNQRIVEALVAEIAAALNGS